MVATPRQQARAVLVSVMSGDLSLDGFHDGWPQTTDALLDAVFEETEDTVEHTPVSWLRGNLDLGAFRDSAPYKILLVDAVLLSDQFSAIGPECLAKIRNGLYHTIDLRQPDDELTSVAADWIAGHVASSE